RKRMFASGYRYRKNLNNITGHPDLWLRRYNTVIFVHGCFWHRHKGCKYAYTPKSRTEFWNDKFDRNIRRDQQVREKLKGDGIRILIVWECTIKKMRKSSETEENVMQKIQEFLGSSAEYFEI
ncbi:MAG: very short patch repair endonuclease, partial [Lachnospiraceae bacterium]|nr:very short patch repair endonuclease [Lachnospiraceae bacterium]